MSELIVLGLIPGTHIQITFALWAVGVTITAVLAAVWLGHRVHIVRNMRISIALLLLVRATTVRQTKA